jgi:diguanylate cyclase (GGDEF)-like protein
MSKGRVLIVDDSQVVRLVVTGYLKAAGYDVVQAASGTEAQSRLEDATLDVVITDLHMPGVDGFEVLAAAKRIAPDLEVIILTGAHADDMTAAIRAMRLGAHDYLMKPPAHADEVVLAVERAMEKKRLRDTNQQLMKQLETLSLTDALTQVGNRRAFDQALERESARALRHSHALSLVLLDIDHFKKINDTYGHEGGDEVLRVVAASFAAGLRKGDSLYRYGGEEFVAILPVANLAGGTEVGRRLIGAVAKARVKVGERKVEVTSSAGVACLDAAGGTEALARADAALYEAKRTGRNRVCAAPPS